MNNIVKEKQHNTYSAELDKLSRLTANPAASQDAILEILCGFDNHVSLILPGETPEEFVLRMKKRFLLEKELENDPQGSDLLLNDVKSAIPDQIITTASSATEKIFAFRPDAVKCAFSSRQSGYFSAGVTLEIEKTLPLIFLNGSFSDSEHYRFCSRTETLAHEMIHAMRTGWPDSIYEEYFPALAGKSRFKRITGNLFRNIYIPTFFLSSIMFLLILPLAFGFSVFNWLWLIALIPILIVMFEYRNRMIFHRAAKNLAAASLEGLPLLIRLTDDEIRYIARLSAKEVISFFNDSAQKEIRFRVLLKRFFNNRENDI